MRFFYIYARRKNEKLVMMVSQGVLIPFVDWCLRGLTIYF